MSDVPRLLRLFDAGLMLRPDYGQPGTVHLARAIAALSGADLTLDAVAARVAGLIGESGHYVLLLADGLGLDLLERLPAGAFLPNHVAAELRAPFPASTAPALTSLATGLWPSEHGVPGWWVYLRETEVHATPLPFVERFSGRSLSEAGVTPEVMFPAWPLWSSLTRDTLLFLPDRIAGSDYTRYVSGGQPVQAYATLPDAVDAVTRRVAEANTPTFTYVYYSLVDRASHTHGPGSEATLAEVRLLDHEVERLAADLGGRVRIVLSADHGSFDVDPATRYALSPGDDLSELLLTPPSGEPPKPVFHVRTGLQQEFASRFRRDFGDTCVLLTTDEVDELRLLGPRPLSTASRFRLGDFLALSSERVSFVYAPESDIARMKGDHGGLSAAEVRIPLVLA